jgi:hypothetical protein
MGPVGVGVGDGLVTREKELPWSMTTHESGTTSVISSGGARPF